MQGSGEIMYSSCVTTTLVAVPIILLIDILGAWYVKKMAALNDVLLLSTVESAVYKVINKLTFLLLKR